MKKVIKEKNKSGIKTKSKILVLGLILVILVGVGLFSPKANVNAQGVAGVCYFGKDDTFGHKKGDPVGGNPPLTEEQCGLNVQQGYYWVAAGATTPSAPIINSLDQPATSVNQTEFEKAINKNTCGFGITGMGGSGSSIYPGCFLQVSYGLFYVVPAYLLAQTAYFFNVLISVSLNGDLFKHPFVSQAWGVVRDLSNIFFILILLYIAVKIILDLGGHEAKKMITKVIIIALLINFSMFFTQVIIDSSNILALIFYNKLNVSTTVAGQTQPREYASVAGEKDVAGGMVAAFDPTTTLKPGFFKQARQVYMNGIWVKEEKEVPAGTLIALILIAGLIMCFAMYALFISGLSFVGRLIELWVLIIFSPFAFMSSTIPLLGGVEYIGWSAWFKRLLKTAFMAPIFMFFLYFIFMLIRADIFNTIVKPSEGTNDAAGIMKMLLGVVLPTMLILILLLKATEFAKKGSGKFGEVLTKVGGQVNGLVTGLALGAATGGAAVLGRATVGRVGAKFANSEFAQKWEARGWGGEYARRASAAIGSGSFDVRGVKVRGKTLAGATGIPMGEAHKGGFTERRQADVEKRQKRADELKVKEDQPLKQALNKTEADLQGLLNANSKELAELDKFIVKKREALNDVTARFGGGSTEAKQAGLDLQNVKDRKKALKDGDTYFGDKNMAGVHDYSTSKDYSTGPYVSTETYVDSTGRTRNKNMNYYEDIELRDRKQDIDDENRKRLRRYAQTTESGLGRVKGFLLSGGQHSHKGAREAAHKIRMEAKVETKT